MSIEMLKQERDRIGSWGELNPYRLQLIQKFAFNKILDVGCANGAYVKYLIERGYDAWGADILRHQEWAGSCRDRFKRADICQLPYEKNAFETIIAFEVLEHVENCDRAIKEFKRVSSKNIILSVPNCEPYPIFREAGLAFHHWIDRTHVNFFTEASLVAWLEKHGLSIRFLGKFNQVFPEKIVMESLHFPKRIINFAASLARRNPWQKKYFMSLLVVAELKK